MQKILDALKREFDMLVDQKSDIMLRNKKHEDTKAWRECYYCHPHNYKVSALQKRVNALMQIDVALWEALNAIVCKLVSKQSDIDGARIAIAEVKKTKLVARAAKVADAQATKLDPYRTLHPLVADMLRKVAEPYRLKAHEDSMKRQRAFIEIIRKAAADCGSFNPQKMFPLSTRNVSKQEYMCVSRKQQEAYVYTSRAGIEWKLLDSEEFLSERANKFADSLVSSFVYKVGMKLSGIVERKGDLGTSYISGDLQDHWMTFVFCDGSSFQVQSQIVWVWNSYGTNFTRYPTCFRNVKMKDGSKMIKPSEAKMRKEFV